MPRMTISSLRVYYQELHHKDNFSILHDIFLYQFMFHKSYRELYHTMIPFLLMLSVEQEVLKG